jgi:isocitrate dehydrogenase (NAD+)
MMLEHLGENAAARKIEQAVRDVIREGQVVTPDLKSDSPYGTRDIAEAIIAKIRA